MLRIFRRAKGWAELKHPVVNVSCEDARAYAKWAGKRLPTAEEWEVAAGFNPKTKTPGIFPWGDEFSPGKCNLGSSSTQPVGSFKKGASPFGCFDMAGNVWEWTSTVSEANPGARVVKGGSYYEKGDPVLRVSFIRNMPAGRKRGYVGFRCARGLRPQSRRK